jgi:hydrophobic/amphiphilic exporter-1 (mainly G- bacteria), HAE1 family
MWISNFSIKNPVITTVLMLALVIFGALALSRLETDEFPDVNPPVISVSVAYPGASPEGVETELVTPLEDAIRSISGVDKIRSSALDGFALMIVEFHFEKDLQQASQDIRDEISEIRADLPPEIEEPILTRFDPQDLPIVSLTLTSERLSVPALTQLADPRLVSELRAVAGVAEVTVVGGLERELSIELRPAALEALGIAVSQVAAAVGAQNLAAPVGRVNGPLEERTIRLRGRLLRPEDFAQLVISSQGDRVVRLGEVASVRDGSEEPRSLASYDGRSAVGIDIIKAQGQSTTAVSQRVRERVAQLSQTLPGGVTLQVVRDAGRRVQRSVAGVQESLIEGALLTVAVVFLFLNSWRSTVITGLALPVSVLASFLAVWAWGFTLNTMSLLGLSLAIGILIDDAIVVRENIVRHMEMGKPHATAAREGTSEIGLAVLATTLSIVVVFLPVAFMGGVAEQWFAPFALTIACSVLVSLLVSFSLDPMLSAVWFDPQVEARRRGRLGRAIGLFNAWFDRQTARYQRVIGWALEHRLATIALGIGSFVGALALPALGLVGGEFFPRQDVSEFTIQLEMPPGSNLESTHITAQRAAAFAREIPEVEYTYTTIGGQGEAVDEANVYVRLRPKSERRRGQAEISDALRARVVELSGVAASVSSGSFGGQKQIQIQIQGPELDQLDALAARVRDQVRSIPGATDVGLSTKGQKPEIDVRVDRALAGQLGITVAQVVQALRPAFAGIDVGDWVDPTGQTRDVRLRLEPAARGGRGDLAVVPLVLPGPEGPVSVPLGQIAEVGTQLGPAQIDHLDGRRVIVVEANTDGRPLNEVVGEIQARLRELPLPPGYTISQGGETESQNEVFGRIFVALAVAVMLMYLILVIQFRSFLDPLAIMASLPLSLIGVMLALLVTGSTLNLMSMIGVILLFGIVAKNAILLIDFAKWNVEAGNSRKQALIEAGGVRFRPILMTSIAIVAGMLPVAIGAGEGGDFRAPLGRAVIGGVITSTLLTLLLIPTFYDILAGGRDRGRAWLQRRSSTSQPGRDLVLTRAEQKRS